MRVLFKLQVTLDFTLYVIYLFPFPIPFPGSLNDMRWRIWGARESQEGKAVMGWEGLCCIFE